MTEGPSRIFDRHALALHRARARHIGGDAFLEKEAALGLVERLETVHRTFSNALLLESTEASMEIVRPRSEVWTQAALEANDAFLFSPEQFDLIVSVLALHAVNDLPGVLAQARRALKPDGLFMAALFGGNTLLELEILSRQPRSKPRAASAPEWRRSPMCVIWAACCSAQVSHCRWPMSNAPSCDMAH